MTKLEIQFKRLLELPSAPNRLTKDLYEAMYTSGEFIAHFDRLGFYRARFTTLGSFDQTIDMMLRVPKLKALYASANAEVVARARFKIASMEASIMRKQAEVLNWHVEQLQAKFRFKI